MSVTDNPHLCSGPIHLADLLDELAQHVHGNVFCEIGHRATDLVGVGGLARKGWQCNTSCSSDLEIIINYVKGMEILLAPSNSLYASCALYWYSIFRLKAFSVFGCGKLLKDYYYYFYLEQWF